MRHVMIGCMYQACTGMLRGIWFVLTGKVIVSLLYPKNDPRNTRGTDTQNHRKNSVKNVPNDKAPEDPFAHSTKFTRKNTKNTTPGYKKAVRRVFIFQSVPLNILYNLDEEYPAKLPMKTKRRMKAVPRDPRFAGERRPKRAKIKVAKNIKHSWVPVPTNTLCYKRSNREQGR